MTAGVELRRSLGQAPGARAAGIVAAAAWAFVTAQLIFFALFQPVWSPIDEFNHFFYIQYVNYFHRPPLFHMPYQTTLDPSVPVWDAIPPSVGRGVTTLRQQYVTESIQPPGYYVLMVAPYRTAPHGSYRQVYAVRLLTAAMAAVVIPVTFLLARILVPGSPWVWGAASLLPALSRGFAYNLSQVTNDALAVLVGSIGILAAVWLLRRPLDYRWGTVAGLIAGVAMITKVTVYYLPVLLALIFLVHLFHKPRLVRAVSAALIGAALTMAFYLPWAFFNLRHYHSLASTGQATPNLGPFTNLPLLHALEVMVQLGSLKFWFGESLVPSPSAWLVTLGMLGLIACTAGFLLKPFWRDRVLASPTGALYWMIGGVMVIFALILATHVAILNGRYLYPLFPAIAVSCAAGADRIGRAGRWLFGAAVAPLGIALALGLPPMIAWSLGR